MDYIDLFLHIYVLVILLLALIALLRASRTQSHSNHEELKDVKEFVSSSPQLKQMKNDVERANDISDNSLQLLVKLKEQHQDLKEDLDIVSANIVGLAQPLKLIEEATQRFGRILLGPQSKGALGEQIIGEQLAQLPQDWVARNVRFPDDKIVEFALRAPNGRLIPIDSKWTATELLDRLGQTTDKAQQEALIRRVKTEVIARAREVLKYLDKDRTMGFCIAAVPDPVFQLCLSIQPRLVAANIVLISYSLLVPYILLIVKLFWSSAQSAQNLQISQVLSRALMQIEQLQQLIDTDVRSPLDAVKNQQTDYNLHNEQLKAALSSLSQIQNEINAIQSSLPNDMNTLTNTKIASIPGTLQHQLAQLRDGLFDGTQNGQGSDGIEQS